MLPQQELLDSINILVDNATKNTTKIYNGRILSVGDNRTCTVLINGKNYDNIAYFGETPSINQIYKVFVPNNNISLAFFYTTQSSDGGTSGGTADYNTLNNRPKINGVTLSGNQSSETLGLYGSNNEPPYPVTSVNSQTGAVSLTIPTQISELANDSNFITAEQAPVQSVNGQTGDVIIDISGGGDVQSVNGKTGDVVLTASDVGALPNTTIIPTKTSQLTNDSGYITNSDLKPYAKTVDLPTKTSDLTNNSGFITNDNIPEYNIVKSATAQDGYIATYYLTKSGNKVGEYINIPKDYLVKSAEIKESTGTSDPSGLSEGTKYIDFVVNTYTGSGAESHIYLNVEDLVDVYMAGNGIEISNNNVISAKVISVNNKIGNISLTASDVGAISTSGGTMTGELILFGNPVADLGAVTKQYVLNQIDETKQYIDNSIELAIYSAWEASY